MAGVSIALMYMNLQYDVFKKFRSEMTVVVLPLQTIVDQPIQFVHWLSSSLSTQQDVLEENARLRARQILLQAKLQKLLSLERENAQLREILSSSTHIADKMVVAQLLSADLDPMTQEVIIDKGSSDGVFIGQPVLDAYGVMGQVIDVGLFSSRILLITDARSAIPVQNTRNGLRSIISGTSYSNDLILLHTPNTADVARGDYFVTSGLGGRFPFGYPVGRVVSIKKTPAQRFAAIAIQPAAHINQTRLVVLLWPGENVEAAGVDGSTKTDENKKWQQSVKVQSGPAI